MQQKGREHHLTQLPQHTHSQPHTTPHDLKISKSHSRNASGVNIFLISTSVGGQNNSSNLNHNNIELTTVSINFKSILVRKGWDNFILDICPRPVIHSAKESKDCVRSKFSVEKLQLHSVEQSQPIRRLSVHDQSKLYLIAEELNNTLLPIFDNLKTDPVRRCALGSAPAPAESNWDRKSGWFKINREAQLWSRT